MAVAAEKLVKLVFRLKKERCVQARCDLIQAVKVAHEEDALQYLEEMRGHIDMLVATDKYGSTLLHEACSRGHDATGTGRAQRSQRGTGKIFST